jgi:hypothetical protein
MMAGRGQPCIQRFATPMNSKGPVDPWCCFCDQAWVLNPLNGHFSSARYAEPPDANDQNVGFAAGAGESGHTSFTAGKR